MHLNADELVDLAEGTRPEASAPHLGQCAVCRARLSDLRSALRSASRDDDVPEPSPFFWEQLSARVRQAVENETPRRAWGREAWRSWRVLAPVSMAAAAALVFAIAARGPAPAAPAHVDPAGIEAAGAAAGPELLASPGGQTDDPSLALIEDLTADIDLDTARAAGLVARGSAEHAVSHLSQDELVELRRILEAELAQSGA